MANGSSDRTIYGPDLSLTPTQQSLLRTALSSNNPEVPMNKASSRANMSPNESGPNAHNGNMMPVQQVTSSPGDSSYQSPMQGAMTSAADPFGFDDSPFIDGQDFDDANFDWDNNGEQLFGDLPGEQANEGEGTHDKRKNEDNEDGNNKRHEGNEKGSKKPGRKPLNSSEPTTKRKAQNRAAQRAFRERKERHLKDLEAKVDDLEKASEATNHENGRLRATVERLNIEVKEYRQRLSLTTTGYSPPTALASQYNYNNTINNDFQFAFPKFGDLPGSTFMSNGSLAKVSAPKKPPSRTPSGNTPGTVRAGSSDSGTGRSPTNNGVSPINQNRTASQGSVSMSGMQPSPPGFQGNGREELNELFSPSLFASVSRSNSSDNASPVTSKPTSNGTRQPSTDSPSVPSSTSILHRASSTSITASPSASSISHAGMDSSCGTTPEPSGEPQEHRKPTEGTLKTINEETAPKNSDEKRALCDEWATTCGNTLDPVPRTLYQSAGALAQPSTATTSPVSDINGIDWMARQNGGQFDPVLFGDYRDTQNDWLSNDFFNDAFLSQDFNTPFNMPEELSVTESKQDLMLIVEKQQHAGQDEVVPGEPKQFLTCDKLWDRVQQSEKAQSGEFDMDNLCSQLKAKAKCSGSGAGAVIEQKDVDAILGPALDEQEDFLKMFK
ncbi:MAG: hypothetical protein Q9181_007614 [Wetmoreana brouardii]